MSATVTRIVAITIAAAVGREMLLLAKQAAIGASTLRAGEAIRMEVTLQPDHANARIKHVGDRKVYHTAIIPRGTLATHKP
jgi:hypothetical protein